MSDGSSVLAIATAESPRHENRFYGLDVGEVVGNDDELGRLTVRYPRLGMTLEKVPLVVLWAGPNRGTYFIPQPGDQVVLGFRNGDARHPYVLGCLWNKEKKPPVSSPSQKKWIVRSLEGHELIFDDKEKSVTLHTGDGRQIKMQKEKIEIMFPDNDEEQKKKQQNNGSGGKQSNPLHLITINKDSITLEAKKGNINLKASKGEIKLDAKTITIQGSERAEVKGGQNCVIKANLVQIN
jgi:uncharacterized protein involved in type VI secretion and phage assembly